MTKARDLANFTASTGVVDADIGSTVQAYDSNLTSFVDAFTLPTSDGSSDQVLKTNGSGTITFGNPPTTLPSFTASGAISAAGVPVALNDDGTVSEITGSAVTQSIGTSLSANRSSSPYVDISYDTAQNKFLLVFQYSSYLMMRVVTRSGTTLTQGSEYIAISSQMGNVTCTYIPTLGKHLVVYNDLNVGEVRAMYATISGTNVSVSNITTVSNNVDYTVSWDVKYNPVTGYCLFTHANPTNYYSRMHSILPEASSITVSTSAPMYVTGSTYMYVFQTTIDTDSGVFYAIGASFSSPYPGYIAKITATSTGASISSTTLVGVNDIQCYSIGYYKQKLYVAYRKSSDNYLKIVDVYDSGLSVGSEYKYLQSGNSEIDTMDIIFNPTTSNAILTFQNGANGNYLAYTSYVGNSVALEYTAPVTVSSVNSRSVNVAIDSSGYIVSGYYDATNNTVRSIAFLPSGYSTNATDFIGFAQSSAADTASVSVAPKYAIDETQSSLTPKTKYYIDYDGSLSSTRKPYAYAGKALTASKILVGAE